MRHTRHGGPACTVLISPGIKHQSSALFVISAEGNSITCRLCGHTSYNRQHVRKRFCPKCLVFHEDLVLMQRLDEGMHEELSTNPAGLVRWHEAT